MTKIQFLLSLNEKLSGLPQEDVEERLSFYSEMIEDRMEEGIPEEDAVAAAGTVEEIADCIIADIPLTRIAKEKIKPKRHLKAWEIILLALGSPIWLSILIAVIAVVISLYASIWSVVISLWAVFVSIAASGFGCVIGGIIFSFGEYTATGIAAIGIGFVLAGLAVFAFFGCRALTKGCVLATKKIACGIKSIFLKKEEHDE